MYIPFGFQLPWLFQKSCNRMWWILNWFNLSSSGFHRVGLLPMGLSHLVKLPNRICKLFNVGLILESWSETWTMDITHIPTYFYLWTLYRPYFDWDYRLQPPQPSRSPGAAPLPPLPKGPKALLSMSCVGKIPFHILVFFCIKNA